MNPVTKDRKNEAPVREILRWNLDYTPAIWRTPLPANRGFYDPDKHNALTFDLVCEDTGEVCIVAIDEECGGEVYEGACQDCESDRVDAGELIHKTTLREVRPDISDAILGDARLREKVIYLGDGEEIIRALMAPITPGTPDPRD